MKFSTVFVLASAAVAATFAPSVSAKASSPELALSGRSVEAALNLPIRAIVGVPAPQVAARSVKAAHAKYAQHQKRDLFTGIRGLLHDVLTNLRTDLAPVFANIRSTVDAVSTLEPDAIILSLTKDLQSVVKLVVDLLKQLQDLASSKAPVPSAKPGGCTPGSPCPTLDDIAQLVAEILKELTSTVDEITGILGEVPGSQDALTTLLETVDSTTSSVLYQLNILVSGLLVAVCNLLTGLSSVLSDLGLGFVGGILSELGL